MPAPARRLSDESGARPLRGERTPEVPRLLAKSRLPRPSTRTRVRREIVIRTATPEDAAACALVDGAYSTSHVWQLDSRQDGDELRVSFRQVRLPRELSLIAPHQPPTASSSQRRGLLWLIAEEVETSDAAQPGRESVAGAARSSAPGPATWSHSLRRTGAASSVQLGLPAPPTEAAPQARSGGSPPAGGGPRMVGYMVAAAAARDPNAYLRTLIVDRAHRRSGVAARFVSEAKSWAARQGADRLIADVPARNYPALRLLQKTGFSFCGFNDCCYPDHEVAVFFSSRLR